MRIFVIFLFSILLGSNSFSQILSSSNYSVEFEMAYNAFPEIPKGMLEGVAYAQTRIQHITGNHEGCIGLPQVSGVMGLTEDGEGYFDNNLLLVSELSGISVNAIKTSPQQNIYAYAAAYSQILNDILSDEILNPPLTADNMRTHEIVLRTLSEIPKDKNTANQFALDCFTFEVFRFLNDTQRQSQYNFPQHTIDLVSIYGTENLQVLQSTQVNINGTAVTDADGNEYTPTFKSLEYAPALWVATPSCNYSSRSGTAISAVTVHTIQGTYAGAISWAQNCSASVSYHYVARSSDGQITQMVYEASKAWHVGSENPYTIGIEHEGYVSDPAWYTEAMYIGSANLVKDICNSGYGISPLRTFQGPATSGSNVLGSCTKIKGHQHYPNQTHTDPGINWDWEHYYQLINDNPTVITYTASAGTFYDSGGSGGNYTDDERQLYLIQPSGVVTVTLSFQSFNLETDWDYLYVYDGSSVTDPLLGVFTGATLPSGITSTGSSILVEFRSDCSTVASGWQISWTSVSGPVPGDVIPPSTTVSFSGTWQTTDFTTGFTDTDNSGGSGVMYQLYQVIDFDGTEWRANATHGFFSDNFDAAIHPEWTASTGTWSIASAVLNQGDEANTNTNIYASLNQDNYSTYLYHWGGKIGGSGTNKRAGFHFMCDDPTLPNRGNSYFVWFREDDNKVQIYEVVNDVFTLMADVAYTFNPNQWYDFKTTFDKNSGAIKVWVNDVLVAGWVDATPYTTGNSVSFRSGNAVYDVNDFKVYHNRGNSELITIGASGDARYQNPNSITPSAKIKSIVVDSSSNLSSISAQLANIDWTAPADITLLNDGTGADIATTTSNTELSANWSPTSDPHSEIASYWYAIGTSAGATDVVNWTDNWFDTLVTHTGLSLVYGTTYYVSVKAENGAGLFSNPVTSNGQLLSLPVNPPVAAFNVMNTYLCQTDSIQVLNGSSDATSYSWSVPGAIPETSADANPYFQFPASGTYEFTLTATGPGGSDTDIQLIVIETQGQPVASFTQSTTTVDIDYAFVTFTNNSTNANGYFWDFGDGTSSSDNEPWHEYTAVGTYTVMLIAINGSCPNDTAWSTVTVVETTGIESNTENLFSVYPSPASQFVVISFGADLAGQTVSVEILDTRGRSVYSEMNLPVNQSLKIELDRNQIRSGIYFVRLIHAGGAVVEKVLVE
ncbi:MAG: N-acetylmuramoyl-L-alanine amidase [Bacteroidetes bacterium]|nr:N-acetylmuramoyl-L-alanine amidase [Bacteroidota bacterium]